MAKIRICFRLEPEELKILKEMAKANNLDLSECLRNIIDEKIKEEIKK